MVKAIKVMLIPNNVQKTKMFQYAGASRFAYNWALAREIENYEKGGKFILMAFLCTAKAGSIQPGYFVRIPTACVALRGVGILRFYG